MVKQTQRQCLNLAGRGADDEPMVRQRVRIRFRKEGDLRFISHRDLLRTIERIFRQADLPVNRSEGFHPRPRMSFPLALSLGVASTDEVFEIELAAEVEPAELLATLRPFAPEGLDFWSAELLPFTTRQQGVKCVGYELPVPESMRAEVSRGIDQLLAQESLWMEHKPGGKQVDVRAAIDQLTLDGPMLRLQLQVSSTAGVSPQLVLGCLGLADYQQWGVYLTRNRVELAP